MRKLSYLFLGTALFLVGCSSAEVEDYASNTPAFDLRHYLNGNIDAWGMFFDNAGKADPMFEVKIKGTWEGNNGTLQEHFIYNDGHTQDRLWQISYVDDHHFTGTAADVVGTALGTQFGDAVDIKYVLTVPTKNGDTYDMSMDDWLYQMNDELVINRNTMSKFGIKVGELVISFHKRNP